MICSTLVLTETIVKIKCTCLRENIVLIIKKVINILVSFGTRNTILKIIKMSLLLAHTTKKITLETGNCISGAKYTTTIITNI